MYWTLLVCFDTGNFLGEHASKTSQLLAVAVRSRLLWMFLVVPTYACSTFDTGAGLRSSGFSVSARASAWTLHIFNKLLARP